MTNPLALPQKLSNAAVSKMPPTKPIFSSALSVDLRTRIAEPVYVLLNFLKEYATDAPGFSSSNNLTVEAGGKIIPDPIPIPNPRGGAILPKS